jgi:hypothetical protein
MVLPGVLAFGFTWLLAAKGPILSLGASPFSPNGLMASASTSGSIFDPFLNLLSALTQPFVAGRQVSTAFLSFGMTIPLSLADGAPEILMKMFGRSALPASVVRFLPSIRCSIVLFILLINAAQWRLYADAAAARRVFGRPWIRSLASAVIPLGLLVVLPAVAELVRPAGSTFLVSLAGLGLAIRATVDFYSHRVGCSSGALMRRALLRSEGVFFILIGLVLLWFAGVGLLLASTLAEGPIAPQSSAVRFVSILLASAVSFGVFSWVACGWFCLLEVSSRRDDLTMILEEGE